MSDKDEKDQRSTLETFRDVARDTSTVLSIAAVNPALAVAVALKPGAPERVSLGVNEGLRDFVRDVPWAMAWLWDKGGEFLGRDVNTSDRGISESWQQNVEDFWDNYIKRASGLGEAEFRMAAGWELPKTNPPTLYNGQANPVYASGDSKGEPIKEIRDITAIFYKDSKGKIEVLTQSDSRWAEIVGPYMAAQIGTIIASMGAGAAAKGAISMPRVLTWGAEKLAKLASLSETAGSMGFLGYNVIAEPLYFKPQAARDLTRMLSNPQSINADNARSALNTLMSQYSAQTGAMTEQNYLPSLHRDESPWARLNRASIGSVEGFKRDHPFDDIRGLPTSDRRYGMIPNTNIRNLLEADVGFQRSFYDLANRALQGGMDKDTAAGPKLTDQEAFALRFMLNAVQDIAGPVGLPNGPIPANNRDRREQRAETLGYLKDALSYRLANEIVVSAANKDTPEGQPPKVPAMDEIFRVADQLSQNQLISYAGSHLANSKQAVAERDAKEEQEALRMGQVMAMGMMP